jgi:hypothetical protein
MMQSILKRFPALERYNQIVWALIGSGVIAVVVVSILIGLAAMFYSMLHSGRGGMQVAVIDEDISHGVERKSALYDFCQPLAVHESPYQLIRVVSDQFAVKKAATASKARKSNFDGYSESPVYGACGIYGSDRQTGTVNVIIRNVDDNSMHLLLKENAVIHSMEYPQPRAGNESDKNAEDFPPSGTLYWEIAFEDSNNDGLIDEKDDLGAYLSNSDGSQLERITPAQSRVLEKSYDKKRNLLTLRILRDINNDKVLDDQDKPSLIEVNVAKRKMIREVLDSKMLINMMQQAEPKRQIK